jgi:tripartite-type tricarboxylate transporter receptor subunit TctC
MAIKAFTLTVLMFAFCFGVAHLQAAEQEKFPTKSITWTVNANPGGGFDLHSRAVARTMRKILGVPIIVKNIPGAAGVISWNLLSKAKPDGYTIGIVNIPGAIVAQLYGKPKPQYDLKKFSWIGRISASPYIWAVGAKTPYHNLKDIQKAKVFLIAEPGVGGTAWVVDALTASTMKFNPKFILGYGGAPAANMGIVRGEGDGRAVGMDSPGQMRFIHEGQMRPLWIYAEQRDPDFPNVPTVGELGYPSLAELASHRVVAAPPGMPADRLAVLEKAFIQAVKAPETQATFKRMDAKTSLLAGPDWVPVMNNLFKLMEDNRAAFTEYMK